MKELHNLRLWVTHVTVSEEMMETGTASLAGLPRKLPRCQDGAILWFAGGEGDYIMQLLEGGKESSLTEADGDGAPSACLEKRCILLLLSVSFFFLFSPCWRLQNKTLHPYLDLKYVLNRCCRRTKKRTAPLSEWIISCLNKATPSVLAEKTSRRVKQKDAAQFVDSNYTFERLFNR